MERYLTVTDTVRVVVTGHDLADSTHGRPSRTAGPTASPSARRQRLDGTVTGGTAPVSHRLGPRTQDGRFEKSGAGRHRRTCRPAARS